MYLLYVDESGLPKGSDEYFVVAGLAIHEEDCYPLAMSLESLQRRKFGAQNAKLELHASRMWSGRHEWARVAQPSRQGLLRAVNHHLATWQSTAGRAPRFFAVAVHKRSFPVRTLERAHEQLFSRFDEFLTRQYRAGEAHRSLVIADDSSYEGLIQTLVPKWKSLGTRMGRLHSFADVPLFVDSRASRLVQAADLVAWSVWQYYENHHVEHIEELSPRFDSDAGVQHGLTHLVRRYSSCACVPCESRRSRVIGTSFPTSL